MDIRDFLEALGVKVNAGSQKSECPDCHEIKLTVSDRKNVASCWACERRFIPGKARDEAQPTWQSVVMNALANRFIKALPDHAGAIEYLTWTRKLPNDIEWLQSNGVGALTEGLNYDNLKAKAMDTLDEQIVYVRAANPKNAETWLKSEKDSIDDFIRRLKGVMTATNAVGSLAFIYRDHRDNCVSISVRMQQFEIEGKARQIRKIQPGLNRGLFNPKVMQGSRWENDGLPPVIVEGEFNWLSLLAINRQWAMDANEEPSDYSLSGCAVGGKDGVDAAEVLKTFEETPLIIYDNDAKADDGMPRGYDVVRAINKKQAVYAVATIGAKDIDEVCVSDGLNTFRLTEERLMAHFIASVWLPRPYKEVGDEVRSALGAKPTRLNYAEATRIIWDDIENRGESYRVKAGSGSFGVIVITDKDAALKNRNRVVQVLKGHPSWTALMIQYGIGASDVATGKLGEEIAARIQQDEKPFTQLYLLAHYDTTTGCMYIDELTHTLKIAGDGNVYTIQNGDEGVIFTPAGDTRKATIHTGGSLKVRDGEFHDNILESVRWDTSGGLSVEAAKQLYKAHVLSIFFDTLMQSKVCPVFEGKGGGGKNSISNLTGRLFEGEGFNVLHMPEDGNKLETLTVDRLYCAFDEFDAGNSNMESSFRSLCTRSYSERRELYNTWTTSIRPLARGIALSTNQNPVRDVATGQRQLMFNVLPRQDAIEDEAFVSLGAGIYPTFMRHRNAIWSELVSDIRAMVMHLAKKDLSTIKTSFRMADFGVLFLACAESEGWKDEAKAMLLSMQHVQLAGLADKHTLVTVMNDYLRENPKDQGQLFTQGQWKGKLHDHLPWGDKQTREKLSDSHLRVMFSGKSADIMKSSFVMEERMDTDLKQKKFSFAIKAEKTDVTGNLRVGLRVGNSDPCFGDDFPYK